MDFATAPTERQRLALIADHRWIDDELDRLIAAFVSGDAATITAIWDPLERFLLVHLDAEEALVYPHFTRGEADTVTRLRRDHAEIRAGAAALGLALENQGARATTADSFARLVREHAQREDRLLSDFAPAHAEAAPR